MPFISDFVYELVLVFVGPLCELLFGFNAGILEQLGALQ